LQAADGGTLFLDEVAELDLAVQAKLLRVLETREVLPLGASKVRRVCLSICSATHGDLADRVAKGTFREDLYYRLGRPEVVLPPLRSRREEIPWHIARAVHPLGAHVSLVEASLLRSWPGNVRELLLELREAARDAGSEHSAFVEARHLHEDAGVRVIAADRMAPPAATIETSRRSPPSRDEIVDALRESRGNVTATARALGTHRTQLRRWIERHDIDPIECSEGPSSRRASDGLP
jgi:transcriptional regulator of acetoin/glycerol metabolism